VAELAGHFIPVGSRFIWFDGPVLIAWRFGRKLIVDEIDLISGPAMSFMRGVANDARVARLTIPDPSMAGMSEEELAKFMLAGNGQQILRPTPGFGIVATMNGDPKVDLDIPLADRFPVKVYIPEPHPNAIASLPDDLQEIARRTARETDEDRRIGIRSWKEFARLRTAVGENMAMAAIFAERSDDVSDALKLARDDSEEAPEAPEEAPAVSVAPVAAPPNVINGHNPANNPRAYFVRSGDKGRPAKAECCGRRLTHNSGEIRPGSGLHCRRCNTQIAPFGRISYREKIHDTGDPKVDWVSRKI